MRLIISFLFLIMSCFPAMANEDSGLYNLPPKGAAFVRLVNISEKPLSNILINTHSLPAIAPKSVTPYFIVTAKKNEVSKGKIGKIYDLTADDFFTVLVNDNDFVFLKDAAEKDITKAQVIVYNVMAKSDLSLKTADGTIDIIRGVGFNASKSRALNPVTLNAAIFGKDNAIIKRLPSLLMENRQSYGIFVFSPQDILVINATIESLP